MNIKLITVGKTTKTFVAEGLQQYQKRIDHYYHFEINYVNNTKIKSTKANIIKQQEAKLLLPYFKKGNINVLLDEKGKVLDSVNFAEKMQQWMNASPHNICFFVGGAFGFHQTIYEKAHFKLRLSSMTFSHQLIRLIFAEQLYRAISIIHRLPYHNA